MTTQRHKHRRWGSLGATTAVGSQPEKCVHIHLTKNTDMFTENYKMLMKEKKMA